MISSADFQTNLIDISGTLEVPHDLSGQQIFEYMNTQMNTNCAEFEMKEGETEPVGFLDDTSINGSLLNYEIAPVKKTEKKFAVLLEVDLKKQIRERYIQPNKNMYTVTFPPKITIGQEPEKFIRDLSNAKIPNNGYFVSNTNDNLPPPSGTYEIPLDVSGALLFENMNNQMNKHYAAIINEEKEVEIPTGICESFNECANIEKDLQWKISTPLWSKNIKDTPYLLNRNMVADSICLGTNCDVEVDAEVETSTEWKCKGCTKYFATKGSLKRHHERKISCKEICEKNIEETFTGAYIVEWVDTLLNRAISGDSTKSFCKHCDIEFANKSNLNKHLSKSVACDKLAKLAFLELLK